MAAASMKKNSAVVFELVVRENGAAVLTQPLSYSAVASIISDARDLAENFELFRLAAGHPATDVRQNVAYKDRLDDATVEALSSDSCVSVLRNLVRSAAFKSWVSHDQLMDMLTADAETAETVANSVGDYENADVPSLLEALSKMADPKVRYAIASSYATTKSIAKKLVSDPDPSVRAAAEERIRNG